MTADIELLPLPEPKVQHDAFGGLYLPLEVSYYTRANMAPLIAEIERLRAEVEALKRHVTLLSNIAYNLAQDDRLSDSVRWSLDDSRKKWDTAIHPAAAQEGK